MKLTSVMGLLCLCLSIVLLATFLIEERPSIESIDESGNVTTAYLGHGQPHPEFDTLLLGGSGLERGENVLWLGAIFGLLQITFFVCCLLLGVRRRGVIGPAGRYIAAGAAFYGLAFVGLILSYRGFMLDDTLITFGSVPLPTAWMLYAVAPIPLLFLLIFVFRFREFIWDEDSERQLAQIVADRLTAEEQA
jgi:hypothetical protein